jgi:hypothetical protein
MLPSLASDVMRHDLFRVLVNLGQSLSGYASAHYVHPKPLELRPCVQLTLCSVSFCEVPVSIPALS